MLVISNWWGIFFSFIVPIVLSIVLSYYAKIEEAEINQKKSINGNCNYSQNPYKRNNCKTIIA